MRGSLSRESVPTIALALVCVLAIGIAAATLNSTVTQGEDGGPGEFQPDEFIQGGQGNQSPNSDLDSGVDGDGTPNTPLQIGTCIRFLDTPQGMLTILAGFLGLLYLVYRRYNSSVAFLTGYTLTPPILIAYFLLTVCVGGSATGPADESPTSPLARGGESLFPTMPVPPWLFAIIFGGVIIGALFVLFSTSGDEEIAPPPEEEQELELDQFAAAAGRAADRIEQHNADVDNAVYRAWVEMTGLLDVEDPETYTAGEFVDAAVEIGMAESDVSELARLFNEVRYGDRDAGTREDQAIEILRSIESEYADEGSVDDGSATDDSGTIDGDADDAGEDR